MFFTESLHLENSLKSDQNPSIQTTISGATMRVTEQLGNVPRVWNPEESVGMHTDETISLAKQYSHIINQYGGSISRVMDLLSIHDLPEILTGDMDPRYTDPESKFQLEEWAMTRLISNSTDRDLWYEYSLGESLDAQFAKSFDKLQFLNELIKIGAKTKYAGAMVFYRKYFEPFPELLDLVDNPIYPESNTDSTHYA